jgi:hypothetical protein
MKITCPECHTEGGFSLADPVYQGPYRCWKCRALFAISIAHDKLQSCEPLSEADFEKWQQLKAIQDKMRRK